VAAVLSSANRDERRWTDPDRFDVHRNEGPHVAFASGAHVCLGAWLGRSTVRAAVQHLTYNYPDEIKRNQVLGGTLSNLLLRARFGTWRDIMHGVMLICGEQSIRDVMAFPKNNRAMDLMTQSPAEVDPKQLRDLGIRVAEEKPERRAPLPPK